MTELEEDVKSKIDELIEEMVGHIDNINEAMSGISLTKVGNSRTWSHNNRSAQSKALSKYETWYNSAHPLVAEYLPDRKSDFEEKYYRIRSSLEMDIGFLREEEINSEGTLKALISNGIQFQISILESIPRRVEIEKLKAKRNVSIDITSEEIQKAKSLFDEGHIRAPGVIAGVALERHLITLCEDSPQDLDFDYMDGITSLAQTLSDANEITDDDQRLLEYLSGIRNKCSHASDEDPEKREVERLLDEANDFIRGAIS